MPNINGISSTAFDSVPLSVQDKIARASARLSAKVSDTMIRFLGQRVAGFKIVMEEDKYKNRIFSIPTQEPTYAQIEWPNQEIALSSSTLSNQSPTVLHAYDILPVVGYFQKKDNPRLQDIFLFNVKLYDDTFQTISLQIIDMISKASTSNVLWVQFILAPITDSTILEHPGYQAIVADFNSRDRW